MYTDKRIEKSLLATATPMMASALNEGQHPHTLSPPTQHAIHHGQHGQGQQQNMGHQTHLHPHHSLQHQIQHLHAQHMVTQHHQHQQQQQQQQHAVLTQQQHLSAAQQHPQLQQQHHHQQPQPTTDTNPNQQQQQQQQSALFARFDANKSTKGASKLRRDLINAEIANLRDLLPLPQSTRQRLSQLQLMALVCVYVRKANYFQQVFKRREISSHHASTPNIGFSKALSGFLMMLTQNGKLLYISDNAAEYLGHSMEDLLIHGDSVYDIIDKQDHAAIQAELNRNVPQQPGQHASSAAAAAAALSNLEGEHRMFLCRMNVSRNARRQMRFGDQKVVLVQGHYLSFLPLCSRNEPVFLATCTPIAMPETRECVVQGATNVFTTIHSMDMKMAHIDKNGEFHLGYSKNEVQGVSWYNLIHSEHLREAQNKHRLITQSEQDRSCILLVRMQRRHGEFIWVHVVLQVRDSQDSNQQPVIVCTNQVLNEREASVMIANSWLYHYYSVQSKIQFGMPFDGPTRVPPTTTVYYHPHHPHPHAHPQHQPSTALPAALQPQAGSSGGYSTAIHSQYHHMTAYGGIYHSPLGAASSSHLVSHHHSNGNATVGGSAVGMGTNVANGGHAGNSYSHPNYQQGLSERNSTQPVDYSQQQQVVVGNESASSPSLVPPLVEELRCSSANSSVLSHSASTQVYTHSSTVNSKDSHHNGTSTRYDSPPPAKKRSLTVGKLEPLYLSTDSPEPIVSHPTDLESHYQNHIHNHIHTPPMALFSAESHGSVVFATVVPTRPRLLNKALPPDPPDFIEQWNPSPPWSETAHKICLDSSCSQQELSPCITTTPPTPTSAPPGGQQSLGPGPAFSFEWMPDQMVPIIDACAPPCMSCISTNGLPLVMAHPHHHHGYSHAHSHHWTTPVPPVQVSEPSEQQNIPHGYRLLSLHSSLTVNEPRAEESAGISVTKCEVVEDVDDRDSPRS